MAGGGQGVGDGAGAPQDHRRAGERGHAGADRAAPVALPGQPGAAGQCADLRPAPAPMGIAGHAWWSDEHFDTFLQMYRDLGITAVRIPLDWKRFEPRDGQYDFSVFDRVFPRLVAAGLELTVYFVTVPAWATSNPAPARSTSRSSATSPRAREPQYRPPCAQARCAATRSCATGRWQRAGAVAAPGLQPT